MKLLNNNDSEIYIIPSLHEVVLGNYLINYDELNELAKNGNNSSIIIDLRKIYAITQKGIKWLKSIINDLRIKNFTVYLIISKYIKKILEETEISKISELHLTSFFDRNNENIIMDIEKDVLWNSQIEEL